MKNEPTDSGAVRPLSDVMSAALDGVRARNEKTILSLIHGNGAMAKADIARISGLSAQTVSVIMRNLEADGLLKRGQPVRGRVGQPSVPMSLNPLGAYSMGLKVGRRSLDMVLVDLRGNVRHRIRQNHTLPCPDETVAFATAAFRKLSGMIKPQEQHRIAGLGIAMPFKLWEWGASIDDPAATMAAWQDRDIGKDLAKELGCLVSLQNDANAACGAELTFGPRDRPRNFIHFFMAYFIGGGVVLDGNLLMGRSGNAGALGSIPIPNPKGKPGQLVDYASLSCVERRLNALGLRSESLWGPPENWDIDESVIATWLDEAAWGLAHAIVATTAVTETELALIDGWLPAFARQQLVEKTIKQLKNIPKIGLDLPEIAPGTIGADGRALGAASLPIAERYFPDGPLRSFK